MYEDVRGTVQILIRPGVPLLSLTFASVIFESWSTRVLFTRREVSRSKSDRASRTYISRVYLAAAKRLAYAVISSALGEEENLAARDFYGRSSVRKRLFVAWCTARHVRQLRE